MPQTQSLTTSQRVAVTLLLVLILWLPRGLTLNRFVAVDERSWLTRSGNFYLALSQGDFARTFQRYHPGVTTMWLGMAGFLWRYPGYPADAAQIRDISRPAATVAFAVYLRALQSLDQDYAIFLHLDDPVSGDLYEAGHIWVASPAHPRPPDGPSARFGDSIELLGAELDAGAGELVLYWRTTAPITQDYSVFVHLLDENGEMLGQLDGAPYANRYLTSAWRPDQIIEDRRALFDAVAGTFQIDRIALGIYDPVTGTRLPACDEQDSPLPDNALLFPLDALH